MSGPLISPAEAMAAVANLTNDFMLPAFYSADFRPKGNQYRAPLTDEVQEAIYEHQHPASCADKRFAILSSHVGAGMGSLVHIIGAALAWAMNEDRILLFSEEHFFDVFASGPYCGEDTRWECFFVPVSSCSVANADGDNAVSVDGASHEFALPERWPEPIQFPQKRLPRNKSHKIADHIHWWRAEAAGYVLRLNERTAAYLRSTRELKAKAPTGNLPFLPLPLPTDAVSIHVRHGDKGIETLPRSWADHLAAANALAVDNGLRNRYIFLSTEDPEVMKDAEQSAGQWDVAWLPWERNKEENEGDKVAMAEGDQLMLFVLENLFLHLECSYFVGTLGSNWNRLIDELRRVWPAHPVGWDSVYADIACHPLPPGRGYCTPDDGGYRKSGRSNLLRPNDWR